MPAKSSWWPTSGRVGKLLALTVLTVTGGGMFTALGITIRLPRGDDISPTDSLSKMPGDDAPIWVDASTTGLMVTAYSSSTPGATQAPPSSAGADPLVEKFAELDIAGIDTVFAAEMHNALYSRDLLASILEGTCRQGPVVLYREIRVIDAPTHPQYKAQCAAAILNGRPRALRDLLEKPRV